MKKNLLFLLLLTFYIQSFSQQTFSEKIQLKGFGSSSNTILATNGDLLGSLNTDSGVYVFRIGQAGNLKWEKLFGTRSYWTPVLCAAKDNGFVCYCDVSNSTLNTHQISLIKCDSLGSIQWERSIGPDYKNNYIYLSQIITNARQDYILTYKSSSKIPPYPETFQLLKFDNLGNLIFQTGFKNLFGRDYQGLQLNSVIETFTGGYLIGFSYEYADDGTPNGYFLFTNNVGDPMSYKAFGPLHTDFSDYDNQLQLFKKDGKYYVLGYYYHWTGSHAEEHYYITSFQNSNSNAKGNFIDYNAFALQRFVTENNFTAKQIDKYVIDKKSISYLNLLKGHLGSDNVFAFNKYDSLGRVCPDYTLPVYDISTSVKDIIFGKEIKGVIKNLDTLVITNSGIAARRIQIIKRDCAGEANLFSNISTSLKTASSILTSTVFPNPAHNTITISLPSLNKQTQISIFNSEGKLLQSFQAYSKTLVLNIEDYFKGIYLLKISNTDQTQILKFIKD